MSRNTSIIWLICGFFLDKERARCFDWRYELAFILENSGKAAAEDVQVTIDCPSDSFIVAVKDEADDLDGFGDLTPPNEPYPRWKRTDDYWQFASLVPRVEPWSISYPASHEREPIPTGPQYFDTRSRVFYQHPKLWPGTHWLMLPIALYLRPQLEAGFAIKYVIHADELANPMEGQLHVRLERPQ